MNDDTKNLTQQYYYYYYYTVIIIISLIVKNIWWLFILGSFIYTIIYNNDFQATDIVICL